MGKPHPIALRERVLAEIDEGQSRRGAAERFKVSASFAVKLAARVARTGSAEPARQGRPPGGGKLAPYLAMLIGWVEAEPDITMPELAAKLLAETGVVVHPTSLSRALLQAGYSVKKTLLASKTERDDVREARHEWKTHRQPRLREEVHRLIFLDETSTTTKIARLRGRARVGARLRAKAPFGHWGTQTFIAGLRCDGLTAPWVVNKPMNRAIFESHVETQLAPTSIRSRWHSPTLKLTPDVSALARSMRCGKLSATSVASTHQKNAAITLSPQGTRPIKRSML